MVKFTSAHSVNLSALLQHISHTGIDDMIFRDEGKLGRICGTYSTDEGNVGCHIQCTNEKCLLKEAIRNKSAS